VCAVPVRQLSVLAVWPHQQGHALDIAYEHAFDCPPVAGSAKPLAHRLDKPMPLCLGYPKSHLRCPVQNALTCAKVCSHASFMSIIMPCIMTDSGLQLFRLFLRWKYDPSSGS
jgi:hypothetical protein